MSRSSAQEALERVLVWTNGHTDSWPYTDEFGGLLRATFARATNTFSAAVILTREGYGPPAVMLARSLFEDTFVAYWMVWGPREPQWIVKRLLDQQNYFRLLRKTSADNYPYVSGDFYLPDEADLREEESRYRKLFGEYGQHPWWSSDVEESQDAETGATSYKLLTRRSLPALIGELEKAAEEKTDTGESILTCGPLFPLVKDMRLMFVFVQSLNNQILHHTSLDILGTLRTQERPLARREGPSEDLVRRAQGSLYLAYEKLIYLMCDRFHPELVNEFLAIVPDGFTPFIASHD
jgi:hypothetical protein